MADIFDFSDYRAYLRAAQRRHPVLDRAITTEEWSKRLGYRSPRSIAMVLKAQRFPSSELIEVFARDLQLNAPRKRYFELLVLRERYQKEGERIDGISLELESLNHKIPEKVLNESHYGLFSEWHNPVIHELAEMPGFQESTEWISQQLRQKVSPETLHLDIERMVKSGILVRSPEGKLRSAGAEALSTKIDAPSVILRRFHAQMMQRAVEALTEQQVATREFASITLACDPAEVDEAKKALREFYRSFSKKFGSKKLGHIFQLNLQFFEHTPTGSR